MDGSAYDGARWLRWSVGPPGESDLYLGYAAFYGVEVSDHVLARLWAWLQDAAHPSEALLVRRGSGQAAGFAHFRPFPRPLSGTVGCFLDDLFVDPAMRGTGAVDALLGALKVIAAERNWSVVRWITDENNDRARAKYDRIAIPTTWVTYDMAPASAR